MKFVMVDKNNHKSACDTEKSLGNTFKTRDNLQGHNNNENNNTKFGAHQCDK